MLTHPLFSQLTMLRADGQNIVNENGTNVVMRMNNLSGWMIKESYLWGTWGMVDAQHEIHDEIESLIGAANAATFNQQYKENLMTEADIAAIASWGYTSVRFPLHWNMFGGEEVSGVYDEDGFATIDQILTWCKANNMYVLLDMHAAPGGQSKTGIADYIEGTPSLWESQSHQDRLVELWQEIASRYADEPYIAGYDLINETFNQSDAGNVLMRSVYIRITDAIREVDTNHILYIEGNEYGNDFTGLTPPWDDNMAYSFHKYWTPADVESLSGMYGAPNAPRSYQAGRDYIGIRETYNVPLFLGETGENSNEWMSALIQVCEANNIGWSFWPMKKVDDVGGPMTVKKTDNFGAITNYWRNLPAGTPRPSQATAQAGLNEFLEEIKIENCKENKDVIDMIRQAEQPNTTIPFGDNTISPDETKRIYAADYDLGRHGVAYFDNDYEKLTWQPVHRGNSGYMYRNDGVDIGWTEDGPLGVAVMGTNNGEWLKYTLSATQAGSYQLAFRLKAFFGELDVTINGAAIGSITATTNGAWDTIILDGVNMSEGDNELKVTFKQSQIEFGWIDVTKSYDPILTGIQISPAQIAIKLSNTQQFSIQGTDQFDQPMSCGCTPSWSVSGGGTINSSGLFTAISAGSFTVSATANGINASGSFSVVIPGLLPGIVEAEDFDEMSGVELQDCDEGRQNIGYLDPGDWLEYTVTVSQAGSYILDYRIATEVTTGALDVLFDNEVKTSFAVAQQTGGWQAWETQSSTPFALSAGTQTMRINVIGSEVNINWFGFRAADDVGINNSPSVDAVSDPLLILTIDGPQSIHLSGISDGDGCSQNVSVTASVSPAGIISVPNVNYSSCNANGSLSYSPLSTGTASVTITVTDNGGTENGGVDTKIVTFDVTVGVPFTNTEPTVDQVSNQGVVSLSSAQQSVSLSGISDGDGCTQNVSVVASVSPAGIISNPSVNYTSCNDTGTLSYSPQSIGMAIITVTVSDDAGTQNGGVDSHTISFEVVVEEDAQGVSVPAQIEAENYTAMQGIETEPCSAGGENIGWTDDGDWLEYVLDVPSTGLYQIDYRLAGNGGSFDILEDGSVIDQINVPSTGGWQNWTTEHSTIGLTQGTHTYRIQVTGNGFNLNWFEISTTDNEAPTEPANLATTVTTSSISLTWNAATDNIGVASYNIYLDGVLQGNTANLNYEFSGLQDNTNYNLGVSAQDQVGNSSATAATTAQTDEVQTGTGLLIEAEDFVQMSGVQTEPCGEGGENIGWIDGGDWMEYEIVIPATGTYTVEYRVASQNGGGDFRLDTDGGNTIIDDHVSVSATGGWQNWTTITHTVTLTAGQQTIGLYAYNGGFNLNWIQFSSTSAARVVPTQVSLAKVESLSFEVYPNPTTDQLNLRLTGAEHATISIYNMQGALIKKVTTQSHVSQILDVNNLERGMYLIKVQSGTSSQVKRFMKL